MTIEQAQQKILLAADNMAAMATTFNSHGYEVFLQARDELKRCIKKECQEFLKKELAEVYKMYDNKYEDHEVAL